ncbi:MAG: hypothetical protein Q9160_008845 [Pyrenula sp. 1 TL-2023]
MATITAPIRSTPSLSIAPTQNTAPVFEYRCLYTRDLRKKKKTWHDGSLRFHTFNRRLMVYDDGKNYIGDHHNRESDTINEGDELKLDKGVLVEVGEQIGRTETDLAPILEKAHPPRSSSPNGAPLRQLPSINNFKASAPDPQGKPKSLVDVLGASQGRIGRARLPLQSPYEQRQQSLVSDEAVQVPPLKKRRLESDKENARPPGGCTLDPGAKDVNLSVKPPRRSTPRKQGQETSQPVNTSREVIEISSECGPEPSLSSDVPRSRPQSYRTPIARASEVTGPASLAPPRETVRRHASSPQETTIPRKSRSSPQPAVPSRVSPKQVYRSRSASPKRKSLTVEKPSARRGTGRIRLAPSQPRVKLIYPVLLESRSTCATPQRLPKPTQNTRIQSPNQQDQISRPQTERRRKRRLQLESSSDVEIEEKRPNTGQYQMPEVTAKDKTPSPASSNRGSSPIFLPATPPSNNRLALQQTPLLDDIDFSTIRDFDFDAPKPQSSPVRTPFDEVASQSEELLSTSHPPPSKLTLMDQRLFAPVLAPQAVGTVDGSWRSPKNSRIRRTQSENDAAKSREHLSQCHLENGKQALPPEEVHESAQPSEKTLHKPFRSPGKLQKSVSDPAAISAATRPLNQTVSGISDDEEDERGAWSKAEAFDLFSIWPPGREKPKYEPIRQAEVKRGGFLSDKVDAL